MSLSLELENDELASLFFYIQCDDKHQNDPVMEALLAKMEGLIYSRFSIDELEKIRKRVLTTTGQEESK